MSEISKEDVSKLLEDPKLRDELLKAMLFNKSSSAQFDENKVDNQIDDLKSRKILFSKENEFKVGDIVIWKEKLKNKNFPLYGQPAIVMEVYDTPVFDSESKIGSHLFKEPHDLLLGIIMDNGDFLTFHYDKRRFKKWEKTN